MISGRSARTFRWARRSSGHSCAANRKGSGLEIGAKSKERRASIIHREAERQPCLSAEPIVTMPPAGQRYERMTGLIDTLAEKLFLHPDTIVHLTGKRLLDLPPDADLSTLKNTLGPVHLNQMMYGLSQVERGEQLYELAAARLRPDLKQKSVLDIGSGLGGALIAFGRRGFSLHGIELNPVSRRLTAENLKFNGLQGDLTSEDLCVDHLNGKKFDVIICNSVIEHVDDPLAFIKSFKNLIKDGGVVLFGVANCEALGTVISDPHYQLFGLTLMDRHLSKELYEITYKIKQTYSVTDWYSIPQYAEFLTDAVGPVEVIPPKDELRSLESVPGLLARVAANFDEVTKLDALKARPHLLRSLEKAVASYLVAVNVDYRTALDGRPDAFRRRFIMKHFRLIARKPL
jgi:2-polyprenyl-3-methyl-5-hydroxy-6-metoxy-1,4-benzoquinol methylase